MHIASAVYALNFTMWSVFPHAEVDNELVQVVFLRQFQQVFPRLFAQCQVYHIRIEPQFHNLLFLFQFDIP